MKSIMASLVFFLFLPAAVFAQETIRLTNGEWPPWLSKDLKHYGVVSHIITEAFAQENIKVEYGFFPWKRAYSNAQTGDYDGSVVWTRKAEREKIFFYSDAVFSDDKVLFHLKSYNFDWNSIDDLKEMKIGATNGYTYGKVFDDAVKNKKLKVDYVHKDELNFRKLLIGRIDVFPLNRTAGYELINKIFTPDEVALITHHPNKLYGKPYHLIISKKTGKKGERFIGLFNKGMKRLRESGKIKQLFDESEKGEYQSNQH